MNEHRCTTLLAQQAKRNQIVHQELDVIGVQMEEPQKHDAAIKTVRKTIDIRSAIISNQLERIGPTLVSAGGNHLVSEIWSDTRQKVAHGIAYSCEQLLLLEGTVQTILSNYVLTVLDALGIDEEAAHHEVIITTDGTKLIEVGCRTQGSIDPNIIEAAIGYSHVSLSIDAVCAPERFSGPIQFKEDFSLVRRVSLVSN